MPDRPDASQDQASAGTKEPSTETVTMTVAELEARDTKTASDALAGAGRTPTKRVIAALHGNPSSPTVRCPPAWGGFVITRARMPATEGNAMRR